MRRPDSGRYNRPGHSRSYSHSQPICQTGRGPRDMLNYLQEKELRMRQSINRQGQQIAHSCGIIFVTMASVCAGLASAADPPSQEELEAKYQEEQRAQLEAYFDRRLEASYGERA